MVLCDVNVLVYVFNAEAEDHEAYRDWLTSLLETPAVFGYSDIVLSAFVRVTTNPRILAPPATVEQAFAFAEAIRNRPNAVALRPARRHWEIFRELCVTAKARGPMVADSYLAALAIESGSEWITTDRDYARFPGLRWRHPLAA
jgi:hypothetical protein